MNDEALVQGGSQWLDLRKTKITSSDMACLMGCAAYLPFTWLQLWERKTGLVKDEQTYAMRQGRAIEESERKALEAKYDTVIFPKVVIFDWMMTSLDGISIDGKTLFEIKLASRENFDSAERGVIPKHYLFQCLWHLACCPDAKKCVLHLKHSTGNRVLDIDVVRDETMIFELKRVGLKFYTEHLVSGKPPPSSEKDYVEMVGENVMALTESYRLAKQQLDYAQGRVDEIKGVLTRMAGDTNATANGLVISRRYRSTADYKRACEDNKICLDSYKKNSVSYWTISDKSLSSTTTTKNGD